MTHNCARRFLVSMVFLVIAPVASVLAQDNAAWTEPFPPFRIAGNLYYVGSKGLANYLITTTQGTFSSTVIWKRTCRSFGRASRSWDSSSPTSRSC
jgi:hypothetical protein